MRRVDESSARIEHHQSQANHPERQLDWTNLLACCSGGVDRPVVHQTCDVRKKERDIQLNPLTDSVASLRYLPTGRIESKVKGYQHELDEVLNLNTARLVANRAAAVDGAKQAISKRLGSHKQWTADQLERWLTELRGRVQLLEYFGAIENWIEKQIRKRTR